MRDKSYILFLHITDFFTILMRRYFFPRHILSCGEFVHLTICHVEKFLAGGPSGLLDFVLHALRALRPCDPRLHPSQANTITRANTSFFHFFSFFVISASKYYFDDDDDDLVVESNAAVRM